VENLPFKDSTFAAVVCMGVLHHLPDMEKAVKEQLRVLKDGGLLFIAEPAIDHSWVSYPYWIIVNLAKRVFRLLRGPRLETREHPLDKENIATLACLLKDRTSLSSVRYIVYWPIVAGYLPEFLAYPLMCFLNRINTSHAKGDTVIVEARK
jgi:SAM-dependent methyltransferase